MTTKYNMIRSCMRYNRTFHSILVANEDDYGARPRFDAPHFPALIPHREKLQRGRERHAFVTLFTLCLCLFLLFTFVSCTKEYGNIEQVQLSFVVETDKLDLPDGVAYRLTEAVLTMQDYNRWSEILTYPISDIDQGITIKKGYYHAIQFTAVLQYQHEGEDISIPVSCSLNGYGSNPQNMIHPQIEATLPLERRRR